MIAFMPQANQGAPARLTPVAVMLLSYCAAFLVSKYVGLFPGYAIDDYQIISRQQEGEQIAFFLTQGRYGTALIDFLLQGSSLNMLSFSVVSLIASMLFSGLFFTTVLAPSIETPRAALASISAVLGAHSYYAEYVTFRQSALPMSMMFALIWLAARSYRKAVSNDEHRPRHIILATLAGGTAMGFNQLAVCYCAAAALYIHLQLPISDHSSPKSSLTKALLRATLFSALVGAVLIGINVLLSAGLRSAFDMPTDGRAAMLAMSQLGERTHQLGALIPQLLFRYEPVASPLAKLTCLAGIAILLIPLRTSELRISFIAFYFLLLGLAITLVPVTLSSTWWPVPRTLISIAFVLAGTASLLFSQQKPRRLLASTTLFMISALLFSAHSNSLLLNQQRLNRWDITQAQAIAIRAATEFPDAPGKIAIAGAHWHHSLAPGIAQGDMNTSALAIGWAVDALFDESTGTDMSVRSAPELVSTCEGRKPFPAKDSMLEVEGEVLVCM